MPREGRERVVLSGTRGDGELTNCRTALRGVLINRQNVQAVKVLQVNYGKNSHNQSIIVNHLANVKEGAVLSWGTVHLSGLSSELL